MNECVYVLVRALRYTYECCRRCLCSRAYSEQLDWVFCCFRLRTMSRSMHTNRNSTYTCIHTYTYSRMNTHAHAHIHTHIQDTYTYTHLQIGISIALALQLPGAPPRRALRRLPECRSPRSLTIPNTWRQNHKSNTTPRSCRDSHSKTLRAYRRHEHHTRARCRSCLADR
jgi:hypothetical protein